MALYAMGDLHLSMGCVKPKPMEVFGDRWKDHSEKIRKRWQAVVGENDTVVIPGDISWALDGSEVTEDLRFIESLPGKKIISKGNHDYWWTTVKKIRELLDSEGLSSIDILQNNAFGREGVIIAGTRGWFYDQSLKYPKDSDYDKIVSREAGRLELSLDCAERLKGDRDMEIIVFLHFPPVWNSYVCEPIVRTLGRHGIKRCYFGHIHGDYYSPPEILHEGISYRIVSSDYLDFVPLRIDTAPDGAHPNFLK